MECPILEEFNECGTACEETCGNFGQPVICTQECVPGCFCKKGYVRENKAGCCIPSELCGASMSDNKLNLFESLIKFIRNS